MEMLRVDGLLIIIDSENKKWFVCRSLPIWIDIDKITIEGEVVSTTGVTRMNFGIKIKFPLEEITEEEVKDICLRLLDEIKKANQIATKLVESLS